jgi:hypothetical protein
MGDEEAGGEREFEMKACEREPKKKEKKETCETKK